MSDPFNQSIQFNYRDSYVAKTDSRTIHNGMIVLSEIPSETDGVVISGYNEIQTNNITSATQFYVDYYLGYVYFDSSKNGTQISASYMGRGIVLYPSSRIYLENPLWSATDIEGIATELQTSITNGDNALSEQVDQITGSVLPAYYKTNVLNYASGATIYDGITSAVTAINTALTHVPSGGTLYFPMLGNGTYLIDSDLTLASYPDISIEWESGAKISVADGKTFTLANTKIIAGLWQIFDLNTSGLIAGTWNVEGIMINWFGAKGDGSTDNTTAIENSISMANSNNTNVIIPNGNYVVSTSISDNSNFIFDSEAYITDIETSQKYTPFISRKRCDFVNPYSEKDKRIIDIQGATIVCYGDSNTKFYEGDDNANGALAFAFSARIDELCATHPDLYNSTVINAGYPGQTIEYGIANYTTNITDNSANIVVIGFGTNNIKLTNADLEDYIDNMDTLINMLLDDNIVPIVLGIPYFDSDYADPPAQDRIPVWNTRLMKLCNDYEVNFIDVYPLFNDNVTTWFNEVTTPKRHYSKMATAIIGEKIFDIITKNIIGISKKCEQIIIEQPSYDNLSNFVENIENYSILSYGLNYKTIRAICIPSGSSITISYGGRACFSFYPRDVADAIFTGDISLTQAITNTTYDGLYYPIIRVGSQSYNDTADGIHTVTITASGGVLYLRGFSCERLNSNITYNDYGKLLQKKYLPSMTGLEIETYSSLAVVGEMVYCSTLNKMVVYNGSNIWMDGSGYYAIGSSTQKTALETYVPKGFKFYNITDHTGYRWDGTSSWSTI